MKRAIVLSGGGSKGAYQIGVWKALKKMHIDYDIVTGTSVGALNAALMIQKNYYRAVWLWHNLDFSIVFDEKIDFDYNSKDGKKELMKFYAKNIVNGGTNVTKLEQTISKTINIDKIYKSKIDMGIVTVKLPTLKPITLTKNQIPKNRLKDYLIASASCYPAFQKKNINGSNYIDGGFYDNLPINLAIDMGAEEVIAIDLKEVGFKQKVKDKSVKVKIISPRNDIGSFLVFDKNMARRCIKLGYNDTMKEFTLLEGNKYTFKKSSFDKFYEQYKEIYIDYLKRILKIEKDSNFFDKLIKISIYKRLLSGTKNKEKKEFINIIENLGTLYELDDTKIYTLKKYNKILKEKITSENEIEEVKKIELLTNEEYKVKYILKKLLKKSPKRELNNLALLFPDEFLEAIYLKIILD